MLRTDDLDYNLPPERIATAPVRPRDASRLMVLDRHKIDDIKDLRVFDLPELLRSGDLLVINVSRVVPARFLGFREDTKGRVEGLYLRSCQDVGRFEALIKARRFRPGASIRLIARDGNASTDRIELLGQAEGDEPGAWRCRVVGDENVLGVLDRVGLPPLPPYIRAARKRAAESEDAPEDPERYQTVFAETPGSVAAPTAGLHLTPSVFAGLAARGVGVARVVLHVGTGTFKPIESEFVEDHPMHAEACSIAPDQGALIREARRRGGRIIAMGTTSARTLEAYAAHLDSGGPMPERVDTDLLITPGYTWRWVDGLMTNFHLPRSTLMAMVAALLPGDVGELKRLYAQAIERGYRFYSYGDAMLVLP